MCAPAVSSLFGGGDTKSASSIRTPWSASACPTVKSFDLYVAANPSSWTVKDTALGRVIPSAACVSSVGKTLLVASFAAAASSGSGKSPLPNGGRTPLASAPLTSACDEARAPLKLTACARSASDRLSVASGGDVNPEVVRSSAWLRVIGITIAISDEAANAIATAMCRWLFEELRAELRSVECLLDLLDTRGARHTSGRPAFALSNTSSSLGPWQLGPITVRSCTRCRSGPQAYPQPPTPTRCTCGARN